MAAYWYQQSAAQGDIIGQYNLGTAYLNGTGIAQDYKRAVHWFRQSAIHGFGDAQYNLGYMFANGVGVLQDYVQAYVWFNLAAGALDCRLDVTRGRTNFTLDKQPYEH